MSAEEVTMEVQNPMTPDSGDRGLFGGGARPLAVLAAVDGDFCAPYLAAAPHPTAPPNLLRIGVHSARGLDAVDKNFFSGKRTSSDPRMKFVVKSGGKTHVLKSTHKVKNLAPVWREHLALEVSPAADDDADWALDVRCVVEDVDKTSSADFMGSFQLRVAAHAAAGGVWCALEDPEATLKRVKGEALVALRWVYEWDQDSWKPFEKHEQSLLQTAKHPPNELRVGLWRARGLAAMDRNRITGEKWSDPLARVQIQGAPETRRETAVRAKTRDPVWKAAFDLPCAKNVDAPGTQHLEVILYDHDTLGRDDVMGKVTIALKKLDDRAIRREWYAVGAAGVAGEKPKGDVEIITKWWYNPAIDPDHVAGRNETLLSYLTPDFLEDAIEKLVKDGEALFYDVANIAVLVADLTVIATEWKRAVTAMSVVVGLVPTVNDAIGEAVQITSMAYKTLLAATGNPVAIGNVLYNSYDIAKNTDSIPKLYAESATFVEAMMTIETFVATVMDVIVRGWDLYQTHWAKMEQKEAAEAQQRAARRGEAYEFEPFAEPDDFADCALEPNKLQVGLSRARELAIRDKARFYGKGTSDPFVVLTVGGEKKKSTVKKKNLDPQWNEVYTFEVTPDDSDDDDDACLMRGLEAQAREKPPPRLEVELFDYDAKGDADSLGRCVVDLAPLENHERTKTWYVLAGTRAPDSSDSEGDADEASYWDDDDPNAPVSGDVELVLRWVYDPDLDPWAPFAADAGACPGRPPNCLRIGVFRASGLAAVDASLLGDARTSDPRLRFEIENRSHCHTVTSTKRGTVEPVWREVYEMRLKGTNPLLTCFVEDVDRLSGADAMGSFRVELGAYRDRAPVKKWFAVTGVNAAGEAFPGRVLLWLQWTHVVRPPTAEKRTALDTVMECLGADGAPRNVPRKPRRKRDRRLATAVTRALPPTAPDARAETRRRDLADASSRPRGMVS